MNIESTLTHDEQALHEAVKHGDAETVFRLLEAGVNASVRDNTNRLQTPLHVAVVAESLNNADCVRHLLNAGALVDALNPDLKTPLHLAAGYNRNRYGGTDTLKLLIEAGAHIEGKPTVDASDTHSFHGTCYDGTPLHIAAKAGNTDAVRLLLKSGADVNAKVDAKHTQRPLHMAAGGIAPTEIIHVLVNAGAKLDLRDTESNSPLMVAARRIERGSNEAAWANVNALLDLGADPYAKCWRRDMPKYVIECAVGYATREQYVSTEIIATAVATKVKLDAITPESIQASVRARKLDALLPKATHQDVKQSDDWHPGMTAPAIESPASTETSAQQIQTRSRSQGLRF